MAYERLKPDRNLGPNEINVFEGEQYELHNLDKSSKDPSQSGLRRRNRLKPYDRSSVPNNPGHISGPHLAESTPLLGAHHTVTDFGLTTAAVSLGVGAAVAATAGLFKRTKEKGAVLPNSEFIGPGNPIPISAAKSEQDQIAKEHDLSYKRKHFSLEEHTEYIHDVDETAIKKFKGVDHWQAKVGAFGLQAKVAIEKSLGRIIYPPFGVHKPPRAPPWTRPNWDRMSETQKRYSVEQWQLSLVRRGIPIDHPIPGEEDITDGPGSTRASSPRIEFPATPTYNEETFNQVPPPTEDNPESPIEMPPTASVSGQSPGKHSLTDGGSEPGAKRTGKSKEASGVGIGSAEPSNPSISSGSAIPRPFTSAGPQSVKFVKVHRFYAYGITSRIYELDVTVALNPTHNWVLMTSLMEIPWDKPYMYLTPSEWNLLPDTAVCENVTCSVNYRNVRQAFETNASTSSTATLNQSNDIISALGLNKIYDGMNFRYSGAFSRETMKYSTITVPPDTHDKELATYFWGLDEGDDQFSTSIPHSLIGKPIAYNCYYGTTSDNVNPQKAGWPNLLNSLQFYDANTSIGQTIITHSYQPNIGFLKTPPTSICRPYPGFSDARENYIQMKFPMFNADQKSNSFNLHIAKENKGGNCKLDVTKVSTACISSDVFSYYDMLEKSQFVGRINGMNPWPSSQPWMHVGIMPSKAAHAGELLTPTDNCSDVQAYFEVTCEMDVSFSFPTLFSHAAAPNVLPDQELVRLNNVTKLSKNKTPVFGMYRPAP